VYEGPVDCVATATDVRLVFVKNHFGLASSNRSYRYVGSFGVDVWNISTGTCYPVLPFDKYGRLLQMAVSPDASMLALLLVNAATSSYVIVFDVDFRQNTARRRFVAVDDDDDVRCVAPHEGCSVFVVAPDWDFMATASRGRHCGQGDVRLWDLDSGDAVVHFQVSLMRRFHVVRISQRNATHRKRFQFHKTSRKKSVTQELAVASDVPPAFHKQLEPCCFFC